LIFAWYRKRYRLGTETGTGFLFFLGGRFCPPSGGALGFFNLFGAFSGSGRLVPLPLIGRRAVYRRQVSKAISEWQALACFRINATARAHNELAGNVLIDRIGNRFAAHADMC
jgi:hypothetical protein